MAMAEKIAPALTAEEWADVQSYEIGRAVFRGAVYASPLDAGKRVRFGGGDHDGLIEVEHTEAPFVIALANAALPDGDPRKITRHTLWIIRALREDAYIDAQHPGALRFEAEVQRLLAALESYLPPEKP
jgi:hypothetical protein